MSITTLAWCPSQVLRSNTAVKTATLHCRALFPSARLTFWSPQLGRSFRDAAYKRHAIKQSWSAPNKAPRTVTVLTNAGSAQVSQKLFDVCFGVKTALCSKPGHNHSSDSRPLGAC